MKKQKNKDCDNSCFSTSKFLILLGISISLLSGVSSAYHYKNTGINNYTLFATFMCIVGLILTCTGIYYTLKSNNSVTNDDIVEIIAAVDPLPMTDISGTIEMTKR